MKASIILLFIFCLLFPGSRPAGEGSVRISTYFYGDPSSTFHVGIKIIWRGQASIQEVPLIKDVIDSGGRKLSVVIKHFSYLDPQRNICCNYRSFSDTARRLQCYPDMDSVTVNGGRNFYSDKRFTYDKATAMSDTILEGAVYKRLRLDRTFNGQKPYLILYYQCGRREFVELFKSVSDSLGCSVVRDDSFFSEKLFMTRRIERLSDTLTGEESKVMSAWEARSK